MKSRTLALCCLLSFAGSPVAIGADTAMDVAPGEISFRSGGIGEDEQFSLLSESDKYNVRMVFAEKISGAYVADVNVTVTDAAGKQVLQTGPVGPWFFARLPDGRYRIVVESGGLRQSRSLSLTSGKPAKLYWYWPAAKP